jgi:hypothetical protein
LRILGISQTFLRYFWKFPDNNIIFESSETFFRVQKLVLRVWKVQFFFSKARQLVENWAHRPCGNHSRANASARPIRNGPAHFYQMVMHRIEKHEGLERKIENPIILLPQNLQHTPAPPTSPPSWSLSLNSRFPSPAPPHSLRQGQPSSLPHLHAQINPLRSLHTVEIS